MLSFPDGFQWGAATAAHQVEGGNTNNDWWDWEQTPGHIKNGDKSTAACDWFAGERYRGDFKLAQGLNQNAHRLSVEWSRLEPSEGTWDPAAFAYYRRVLTTARECGLTPLVTLHHFTNPRWLVGRGGWETEAVVPLFDRFVAKVVQEFGDLCDFWVTINEPVVYAYAGYVDGYWPPGKKNFALAMRVLANMLRGHAAAYRTIHRLQPLARAGLAHNLQVFRPAEPKSNLNRAIVNWQDRMYNRMVLLALDDGELRFPLGAGLVPGLAGAQDYYGLNYYFSHRMAVDWRRPLTLFGRVLPARPWGVPYDAELDQWFGKGDIDPEAFYGLIHSIAGSGMPIYITENGIADRNDELRPRYLVDHLKVVHRAIGDGVPIRGYFYWSLLDNFEWAEGYTLPFGLIHTDFATQERTIKPSGELYARIAKENAIADGL